MAYDQHYIPAFSIEDVLLDKDTGAPLSGGLVYFEEDNQRGVLKPVYQITGTSPNYTFIQLPNPVVLSSIGTFQDALGNPQIPYFYPYVLDADGNLVRDYYYIRVTSSEGVPQFTREAQPYFIDQTETAVDNIITNELSNPQFGVVTFDQSQSSFTYTLSAPASQVLNIAPDWELVATGAGAVTITLSQLSPVGSDNLPTNPGTILSITSSGVTSLILRQRIFGSPNLWGSGNISCNFVAKTYSGAEATLSMYYSQSNGAVTGLLIKEATLAADGSYGQFQGSVLVPTSDSTESSPTAYIDIYFQLPINIHLDITSVMIASTGATVIPAVDYDQQSFPRQVDHLFHDYKDPLLFKPVSSYLVGWDFPLNPAQEHVSGSLGAIGANKGAYAWDQTIIYQTVDNSVGYARDGGGSLLLTTTATTQIALIQYLPANEAIKILENDLSSYVRLYGNDSTTFTVSLWWSTAVSLPVVAGGTNDTFVLGLDASGHPSSVAADWTEVPRGNYGRAVSSLTTTLTDHPFIGWQKYAQTVASTATFFAIVVGTSSIASAKAIGFNSISLVPGQVATIPAPQTLDEVLRECQYYYETTYGYNIASPTASITNSITALQNYIGGPTNDDLYARTFSISYAVPKRVPITPALYSYMGTAADSVTGVLKRTIADFATGITVTGNWIVAGNGNRGVSYVSNTDVSIMTDPTNPISKGSVFDGYIAYHYIADARLGIV